MKSPSCLTNSIKVEVSYLNKFNQSKVHTFIDEDLQTVRLVHKETYRSLERDTHPSVLT
jgi:hypothetical protein